MTEDSVKLGLLSILFSLMVTIRPLAIKHNVCTVVSQTNKMHSFSANYFTPLKQVIRLSIFIRIIQLLIIHYCLEKGRCRLRHNILKSPVPPLTNIGLIQPKICHTILHFMPNIICLKFQVSILKTVV